MAWLTLVDYGLNVLMNMVVYMLARDGWCISSRLLNRTTADGLILESGLLGFELVLDALMITVIMLFVLNRSYIGVMLFGQSLLMVDGLDGGMVMVLMNLLVDGSSDVLVRGGVLCLTSYCWGNLLMDMGIMVPGLAAVRYQHFKQYI